MSWMNLESVIQSEVSQKEKKKYGILMYTYGIQKDGTDENYLQRSNGDTGIENRLMDVVGDGQRNMETYITL